MSDERFLSELEINYAFTFDVDQIIRAADFDKPTLFLCGRDRIIVSDTKTWRNYWMITEEHLLPYLMVPVIIFRLNQNSLFQEIVRNWLERIEGLSR